MVQRFAVPASQSADIRANVALVQLLPRYAIDTIAFGALVFIVLVLLATGMPASGVVPILGLCAFAGYRLMPALQVVLGAFVSIRFGRRVLDEVHAMFTGVDAASDESEVFLDRKSLEPPSLRDCITVEGLAFHDPNGDQVLHDLSLETPYRSSVAFVGPVGAGKATMVDVLLGLPEEAIDMEAVKRAARMVRVASFIEEELPDGYGTIVEERGVRPSGGQRQRMGIARALSRPGVAGVRRSHECTRWRHRACGV